MELGSPALQADSSPTESQEKPKNTGVGRLSLLQQIFPTQEWNWGLLHCRRILDQLSRLGFPGALPQRRVVWMWFGAFPGAFGAQLVKYPPAMQETPVPFLGQEDPLEKG